MVENVIKPPSEDEINRIRRDASEGDPNAAAFFRNKQNADAALEAWRAAQNPPSSE